MNTSTSNLPTIIFLLLLCFGFKSFSQTSPPSPHTHGQWSPVIEFDIVPVAIANLPDGRLVTWSSKYHDDFDMNDGYTFTQIFDPLGNEGLGSVLPRKVTETFHDMFCPGINNLPDGRLLVTGGSSDEKTSIYDPKTGIWTADDNMKVARGYQGAVTLADGSAFTIGGSWNDGVPAGGRDGEIWRGDAAEGQRWTHLTGLPGSILYNQNDIDGEPEGVYRLDNHAWLFAAPNGEVFHAGPGEEMHWFDVSGDGTSRPAGPSGKRGSDYMAMNGGAAMFDIGKILKVGGSASYSSNTDGNPNTYVIDINNPNDVTVTRTTNNMEHARIYVSTVVLPNGEVLVLGGLDHAEVFVDDVAYLSAEMFTPDATGNNGTFRTLASMEVPRTYHSAAILLKDGRVFMGGGGLCGENCAANHKDAEIYSPPYLFNSSGILAERPRLKAPDKAFYERPLTVTASPGIQEFSFMRMSSATHSVNNEQRRVPVIHTEISPGNYQLTIPQANLMPPGYYMLFAIDAAGVPSIAETVLIGAPDSRLNGENLLVEYDFFEGTGTLIRDTSGNDNHGGIIEHDNNGTSINPPTGDFWSADGLSGNALEMDGMEFNSNSIVEISNSSTIGEALTDQITVMAWVNRNVDSRLPDGKIPNVAIFTHVGELSSGYSSFFMGYHADEYKLEFFTDNPDDETNRAVIYHKDKRYTPGVWEHLVGTYDGQTASLYVNGELLESETVIGNLIINTAQFPNNAFTLSGFYDDRVPGVTEGMPADANGSGITDELDGRMDNFKLYNIALTQEEIRAIYNKEYKVEEEEDPCDDYYLVYEIGDNSGSGSKEIDIREGDSIRLTLNDETVDYIVTGPDGQEIPDGIINNITQSGVYTVATTLNQLEAVQDVTIHDFCSQETAGRPHQASLAIDENIRSYWHTLWKNEQDSIGVHNHFIDLDLGVETPVFEYHYLPRPEFDPEDGEFNWLNGTITEYNIYVSSTTDVSGDVVWGSPAATGMWAYNHDLKTVDLGGVIGRYVRLEALETRDKDGYDTYASAADIKVMTSKECAYELEIKVVIPKTYTYNDNWETSTGDPSGVSNEFDDIEIVNGTAVISKSTSARNITIAAGAALTVDPEAAVNLSIRNRLTLNSTSTSYASLIENGYLTGTVFYNRYVNKIGTSAGGGNDLISSPLTMVFDAEFVTENQGVLAEHSETSGIFAFAPYNVTTGKYENFNIGSDYSGKIPLVSGAGYRAATVNGEPLQFKGKTNKNAVSIPISDALAGNAWNLIGNPYPSYLDFEMFITENASQLNADSDYQAVYGYTGVSNTWTVWNQATIDDPGIITSITPGQGFFVNAKQGGGIIRFTPEMRITGNTDDFIDGRPSKNIALSKLKLSDSQKSDVTSIYFIDGTTRGLDRGYDAGTFTGVARDFLIYTNLVEDHSGTNIAIQSLPYDDFNEVTVPLGIKAKAGAELSISIDSLSTIPSTINVYLEDKQENTMVLLNKGSYTFTSTVELNTAERFNIHYSSKPLSIDNLPSNDNIRIYVADAPKSIMILGQLKSATTASVYDLHGRMVLSKALNANSTENAIDVSTISTGVYIVRLGNDHQVKTQKVIIK